MDNNLVPITVSIPQDARDEIAERAHQNGRTFSDQARRMLAKELDRLRRADRRRAKK